MEGTGARGGKGAKRGREAGISTIWRRNDTNKLPKRLKTGSDGWIRLILGSYWLIEGLEWSLEGGSTSRSTLKSTKIHQNPSILDDLDACGWLKWSLRRVLMGPKQLPRREKEGKSIKKETKAANLIISRGSRGIFHGFSRHFPHFRPLISTQIPYKAF